MGSERVRERKYRRGEEITAAMLIGRLKPTQLAELVGNPQFQAYEAEIIKHLQTLDDLSVANFRKTHFPGSCEVEELVTGRRVRTRAVDIDFVVITEHLPEKRLSCKSHGVTSVVYIESGRVYEGPFDEYYIRGE